MYGIWSQERKTWARADVEFLLSDDLGHAFMLLGLAKDTLPNFLEDGEHKSHDWVVAIVTRLGRPKITQELRIANEFYNTWYNGDKEVEYVKC